MLTVRTQDKPVVTVSRILGVVGDTVEVEISIDEAVGMAGGQFKLRYDPSIAVATKVTAGEALTDFTFISNLNEATTEGYIRVAWVAAEGATSGGIICRVTFQLQKTGTIVIAMENLALNDIEGKLIVSKTINGEITVAIAIESDGALKSEGATELDDALLEVEERAVTFNDITGHWAQEDIETMFRLGFVKGVSATEFAPDQTITRAEFVALLVRALGIDASGTTGRFTDVAPSAWYFEVVNAAAAAGLVNGYGDNTFGPSDWITREQMASMMAKALSYREEGMTITAAGADTSLAKFKDQQVIAGWARQSVAVAVASGIIVGRTSDTFAPKTNTTRAEGAVMILRLYRQLF